ncbi:hypothetical protein Pyn_18215 [Prunus yedoensis var. nudiflora]|uniref:Uncharacterized protein n=1 Tax=Prunus yedoensis var. nudiflora TaxID=2094558 RepID=A0A314XTK4_PRUYE|nr:hypothetical protein Pyn_18215 [Prunus yedoensis var. nudiflora]
MLRQATHTNSALFKISTAPSRESIEAVTSRGRSSQFRNSAGAISTALSRESIKAVTSRGRSSQFRNSAGAGGGVGGFWIWIWVCPLSCRFSCFFSCPSSFGWLFGLWDYEGKFRNGDSRENGGFGEWETSDD